MYTALLLVLPALGVAAYLWLRRRMAAAAIHAPPGLRLLVLFAAYGTLLLLGVSEAFGAWSAAHSLGAALLLMVATPGLVVQGLVTAVRGAHTGYHRAVAALSLSFPLVLAATYLAASARA